MKYLLVTELPLSDGYRGWLLKELSKLGLRTAEIEFCSQLPYHMGKATASDINAAAEEFYAILREFSPKVVVPMGGGPFRAVTGINLPIDKVRGYIYTQDRLRAVFRKGKVQVGEYKTSNKAKGYKVGDPRFGAGVIEEHLNWAPATLVIPTYSVQYVIRNRMKPFYAFAQDFRRIERAAADRLHMVDRRIEGGVFRTTPLPNWEPFANRFAFDIETPMDSRDVRQISFSDGVETMTLMWDEEVREYARKYLGNPGYRKFAHNAMFDVPRLRDAGCPVEGVVFDTMIGGQILQPDLPKALGKMASLYLDAVEWKSTFELAPEYYSAKDAFMTWALANEIIQRLKDTGMMELSHYLMSALPTLLSMHEEGIRVDTGRAAAWVEELGGELAKAHSKWLEVTIPISLAKNAPEVKPSSPAQIQKLLYTWLGMEPQSNKDDGRTTDAEALFTLKKAYPENADIIGALETYRTVHKQYTTYAKTLAGVSPLHPLVHPQYLPGANEGETFGRKGSASTGRLGVSDPNPQNMTMEAKLLFIPDSPMHAFRERDYSQAELRVIGALSQDQKLIEALKGDIHQTIADRLGIPRLLAKNTIYASCYLGGAPTIQKMLKKNGYFVEIRDIKRAQLMIRQEFTKMYGWQQAVVAEGVSKGYLVNPFGRVRFFYNKEQDGPEMADFNPQSTVADIMWRIMPQVNTICKSYGGRLITQVHDSLLYEVLAEFAEIADTRVQRVMEQPFDEVAKGFYIPTSLKKGAPGASWGELVAA